MKTQRAPANLFDSARVLFVEARRKFEDSDINLKVLDDLKGKTISLAASIQYIGLISKVRSYLESKGKKVVIKQGAYYKGHVLGCSSVAFDKSADTLLLITDGKFHAINNAIQLQKEIYIFTTKNLEKIEQKEIDVCNKKTQIKKVKFLAANKIGLIVSVKHGQHQKSIHTIKDKIEKLDKRVYVFEADNINTTEFENFPQIEIWVNTACYGLARDDSKIINLSDILEFLN
ncbi:diphthamide synthesis protein [Candidatus Pacearchaeota archaeon]|nr:diphthamide synthesis protein [Candidatus Pacearchaeota archaeon]